MRRWLAVLFAVFFAMVATASNNGVAAFQESTTITVPDSDGPPGGDVALPLQLDAKAFQVGAVTIRVRFPKAVVTFKKLEPSGLTLGVEAKLQSRIDEAAGSGASMLEATISTITAGDRRTPIPSGPLMYVVFAIDKSVRVGTTIPLPLEASAVTTDEPPKPVAISVTSNTNVIVSSLPVANCFFYMH